VSTNGVVGIDEDPVVDKALSYRVRTVDGQVVLIPVAIIADGDSHNLMAVRSDKRGQVNARPDSGTTILTSTPDMTGTSTVQVAAANAARRGLWITNNHTAIVCWAGDAAVAANKGIPIPPKATLFIDRSPAAAWHVKPEADLGSDVIAVLEELD
jgi:hypothetical protein